MALNSFVHESDTPQLAALRVLPSKSEVGSNTPQLCCGEVYYTVCKKKQNGLLVLASVLFMLMYSPFCLILLSVVIFATYGMVCFIDRKEYYKKRYTITATVVLLGMLAFFKYLRFDITISNRAISGLEIALRIPSIPILDIILPVGISFYLFQSIGYVWDVYLKRVHVEKNFIKYFLFLDYSNEKEFTESLQYFRNSDHMNSLGEDMYTKKGSCRFSERRCARRVVGAK